MSMHESKIKMPNRLIQDATLSFSARRLGAVLYSRRNRAGLCHKSLSALATLSGLSVSTVQKSLGELISHGYIVRIKSYRYNETLGRAVFAVSSYRCELATDKDYTLIPRRLFNADLQSSAFVAALYIYQQMGNKSRCFPSLAMIANAIGASISTVCRALKAVERFFYRKRCKKVNRAFTSNSYHFLHNTRREEAMVQGAVAEAVGTKRTVHRFWASFASRIQHSTPAKVLQAFFQRGVLSKLPNYSLDLDNGSIIRRGNKKVRHFHFLTFHRLD